MDEKNQCIALYKEAFSDNDFYFEEKLFNLCFKYCRFIKDGQNVASMLFLLPCKLLTKEKEIDCYYLYAAATLKKYRNKGYFTTLLNQIKKETIPLFLRPANTNLINFYSKLGFKCIDAFKCEEVPKIIPNEDFKTLCNLFPEIPEKQSYTAMHLNFNEKLQKINFIYTLE